MPTPPFRGFFINLDRNRARLHQMNTQLADLGMTALYTRIAAVDGSTLGPEYQTELDRGNLGLWLTHERLIEANRASDRHLHIMEDDALLPKDTLANFSIILDRADKNFPAWDLLFTEIYLQMGVAIFRVVAKAKEAFQQHGQVGLAPLKQIPFAGTSSIFINKRSLDKYLRLMKGNWTKGYPIDLFLRSLVAGGALNALVTLPFLTTLSPTTTDSDIRGELNAGHLVLNIYRRAAFKDADIPALNREIEELSKDLNVSDLAGVYLKVLRYCLSDKQVEI
jgi:GR25 family glycosyltransferase involved in LPS biosynthesis